MFPPAITKEDFLCAVDLIFSTIVQHDLTACHSNLRIETIFGDYERQKLASLPRDQRKSHLADLMGMLSKKDLGATTDEDNVSQEEVVSSSPPPIPPREDSSTTRLSTSSIQEVKQETAAMGIPSHPPTPPSKPRVIQQNGIGAYSLTTAPGSDSDSSDFEHFTPPVRLPRKRYRSEPHCRMPSQRLPYSSPYPSLKGSSAVLTRKPTWLKPRRSRSLDERTHLAVQTGMDSDDNSGGTMDSGGYAKPFAHLRGWRKILGFNDGSLLSGSLPRIDKAGNELDDTYLDPSELAVAVSETEVKLGRRVSRRLRKRMDAVLNAASASGYYLPLVSTLRKEQEKREGRGEGGGRQRGEGREKKGSATSTFRMPPITPYISMQKALDSAKDWKMKTFTFPERPESSQSGYASDASSTEWYLDEGMSEYSGYARIPEGPHGLWKGFDNVLYDSSTGIQQPTITIDTTYAAIDDLDIDIPQTGQSDSQSTWPIRSGVVPIQRRERRSTEPILTQQDSFCPINKPPTPPPRPPPRNYSTDSILKACREEKTTLKPPGVSY